MLFSLQVLSVCDMTCLCINYVNPLSSAPCIPGSSATSAFSLYLLLWETGSFLSATPSSKAHEIHLRHRSDLYFRVNPTFSCVTVLRVVPRLLVTRLSYAPHSNADSAVSSLVWLFAGLHTHRKPSLLTAAADCPNCPTIACSHMARCFECKYVASAFASTSIHNSHPRPLASAICFRGTNSFIQAQPCAMYYWFPLHLAPCPRSSGSLLVATPPTPPFFPWVAAAVLCQQTACFCGSAFGSVRRHHVPR